MRVMMKEKKQCVKWKNFLIVELLWKVILQGNSKQLASSQVVLKKEGNLTSSFQQKLKIITNANNLRSFGAAWQACRQNNENIAKSHAALGQTLATIVNDLITFRKELCKQKDQVRNFSSFPSSLQQSSQKSFNLYLFIAQYYN